MATTAFAHTLRPASCLKILCGCALLWASAAQIRAQMAPWIDLYDRVRRDKFVQMLIPAKSTR